MGAFFVYIVKSAVCLAVFYLFYRLLLSRETFHRFNRIALLGILILSCAIPFVEVTMKEPMEVSQQLLTWEELLLMANLNRTATIETAPESVITWREALLMVYLLGIVFFFLRNVWSLTRMLRLIKGSTLVRQENGITLITHQKEIAPFSWMKFVVISEKDLKENGEEILTHEYAHIRKRHSIDLLIADICIFFQWFNPASWLLKQELQNIHEFEADESVIAQGIDAKKYQLLLIKKAVGTRLYSMANSFNHSSLKKRITMMLKKKSNNWARLKLALLVPVGLAALSAFARPEVGSPPAVTGEIHLSVNKSTVNQETVQQDHAVFLTYKVSGSEDLNRLVCKTLDRIRTRVAEGQFKNTLDVTINPAFGDVPASYLEKVKAVLEEKGIKCKIDKTVPNTVMDDVAKPYRKNDDAVFLIQNKKIVAALSIERFSANQNDSRLNQISKSVPLILQPENAKVSRQEVEKLKGLLEKKGWVCKINMHAFKIGDAAAPPPPPPPPAGQVVFSYRDGQPDQQFVLYDRHAKLGPNLGQRIDKIYSDNITKVTVRINKKAPKELLETVKQELKKKIDYPVRYEILQFVD